jgi:4-hydroxy-3-polyprenylbenzoate decarboxylase
MKKKKIAIAISGASGSIYARLLLLELQKRKEFLDQCAVVFSSNAVDVWKYELDANPFDEISFPIYQSNDFMAPIASGSARFDALVVCPCSMGTLSRIATGVSESLITRAADVMLKERKKLILVIRETPYNLIHLKNMQSVTEAGAIICPASPSFYSKPQTIEELAMTVVNRILSLLDIPNDMKAWGDTN